MPSPLLVVLDLNKVLLCRSKSSRAASRRPAIRPYLSLFLSFLFRPRSPFTVFVWSSARPANVSALVQQCGLGLPLPKPQPSLVAPQARDTLAKLLEDLNLQKDSVFQKSQPKAEGAVETKKSAVREQPRLAGLLTRDHMGLSAEQYGQKVDTVKDLSKIWAEFPRFHKNNTVLLDDSASKARLQPNNHLSIPVYNPFDPETKAAATMDRELLTTIAILHRLSSSNVSDVTQQLGEGAYRNTRLSRSALALEGLKVAETLNLNVADGLQVFNVDWWKL